MRDLLGNQPCRFVLNSTQAAIVITAFIIIVTYTQFAPLSLSRSVTDLKSSPSGHLPACKFTVTVRRAYGPDYQIEVLGAKGDIFAINGCSKNGCGASGYCAVDCISGGYGAGVNIIKDQVGKEVAYGNCCSETNSVVATVAECPEDLAGQSSRTQTVYDPDKCFEEVQGGFKGPKVYRAALKRFGNEADAFFVELGAYMGQSTCFMAQLIQQSALKVRLDVIDFWSPLQDGRKRDELTSYSWIPEEQRKTAMERGKGEMSMAWAYNMYKTNSWNAISGIVHGSDLDTDTLARYQDDSIHFLYLDTTHHWNVTLRELAVWWPKLKKAAGLFCGNGYSPENKDKEFTYEHSIHEFFVREGKAVWDWGDSQFCVGQGELNANPDFN